MGVPFVFEAGSPCVAFAGLELTRDWPASRSAGMKGVHYHTWLFFFLRQGFKLELGTLLPQSCWHKLVIFIVNLLAGHWR